jgi:hypothetical protein
MALNAVATRPPHPLPLTLWESEDREVVSGGVGDAAETIPCPRRPKGPAP